jgi:hypothetical protein
MQVLGVVPGCLVFSGNGWDGREDEWVQKLQVSSPLRRQSVVTNTSHVFGCGVEAGRVGIFDLMTTLG